MTRKKKLMLNTVSSLLKQIIAMICGFILPRFTLLYFGSSLNGLASSISYFLGFISLLDMGVGAVIKANLYKPLADNDNNLVSRIFVSSDKFFRRIAYIFVGYILLLFFVYPTFINTEYNFLFTASLIVIISISSFAQYYFGITNQLLLDADQKAYVQTTMQIVTIILNTVISIVLMKCGASLHVVKLAAALVFVLRPIGQSIYVKRFYSINKKIEVKEEPIKQKWNGLSQHVASVVCTYADVVILTFFSTLQNVSVYSVYFLVTNGVTQIVMMAATGVESMLGNMIAKGEKETLEKAFISIEWIVHLLVTLLYSATAVLIVPFVKVYTKGITDADYIVPLFGVLLVCAYAAQCLRIPYFRVIKAAGHFKQTQNGAYISAILNIILSIALVFKFGLVGIAIGTLVAMIYHTFYFVWYLRKEIVNRKLSHFLLYVMTDIICGIAVFCISGKLSMDSISYGGWIVYAIKVFAIDILVVGLVNLIFYRQIAIRTIKGFR